MEQSITPRVILDSGRQLYLLATYIYIYVCVCVCVYKQMTDFKLLVQPNNW